MMLSRASYRCKLSWLLVFGAKLGHVAVHAVLWGPCRRAGATLALCNAKLASL